MPPLTYEDYGGEEGLTYENNGGEEAHSGFGPSDWPIWTDFVGENFWRRALFFGKSYRENKNCSGSENTPKKL